MGDEIHLAGSAKDAEGNSLSEPLNYYWTTRLLHCPTGPTTCHAHSLQIFSGVKDGEFLAPEHDYPSFIEITLRVADDRGLTASKTIEIEPRAVNLTIASSPPESADRRPPAGPGAPLADRDRRLPRSALRPFYGGNGWQNLHLEKLVGCR